MLCSIYSPTTLPPFITSRAASILAKVLPSAAASLLSTRTSHQRSHLSHQLAESRVLFMYHLPLQCTPRSPLLITTFLFIFACCLGLPCSLRDGVLQSHPHQFHHTRPQNLQANKWCFKPAATTAAAVACLHASSAPTSYGAPTILFQPKCSCPGLAHSPLPSLAMSTLKW